MSYRRLTVHLLTGEGPTLQTSGHAQWGPHAPRLLSSFVPIKNVFPRTNQAVHAVNAALQHGSCTKVGLSYGRKDKSWCSRRRWTIICLQHGVQDWHVMSSHGQIMMLMLSVLHALQWCTTLAWHSWLVDAGQWTAYCGFEILCVVVWLSIWTFLTRRCLVEYNFYYVWDVLYFRWTFIIDLIIFGRKKN